MPLPAAKPKQLGDGFTSGNGRIEAVEVDIAAKAPGRLLEILVNEGDSIAAGQILARMDTAVLEVRRREAEAQLQRALIGVETARSQVTQREADQGAAVAVVAQRGAELDVGQRRTARSEQLFRVRARIDPELLARNLPRVKTGLPGMAYVRLDPAQVWPDRFALHVPN